MKGAVSLLHIYTAALKQPGIRILWALTALHNYNTYGADAKNAFADAPPPAATFYVTIDWQYREWWKHVKGMPSIPEGYMLPVQHALQGHPESPQLWAKIIYNIIVSNGFTSTTHKPCLYTRTIDGSKVFFLRKVDDFAVSMPEEAMDTKVFKIIQRHLKLPVKFLGKLDLYNGLDIYQTKHYVKIHCKSYLIKVLQNHGWLETISKKTATPMAYDKTTFSKIHDIKGPGVTED